MLLMPEFNAIAYFLTLTLEHTRKRKQWRTKAESRTAIVVCPMESVTKRKDKNGKIPNFRTAIISYVFLKHITVIAE